MGRPNDEDYNFYENDSDQNGKNPYGSGGNNYTYEVLLRPKTRAWSIVAIILGIASVICCCLDFVGIIAGVLSIVFALISRKTLGYFDATSIAAIIVGIFGIVLSVAMIIVGVVLINSPEYKEMILELEKLYGVDINGDGLIDGLPSDAPSGNPNEF